MTFAIYRSSTFNSSCVTNTSHKYQPRVRADAARSCQSLAGVQCFWSHLAQRLWGTDVPPFFTHSLAVGPDTEQRHRGHPAEEKGSVVTSALSALMRRSFLGEPGVPSSPSDGITASPRKPDWTQEIWTRTIIQPWLKCSQTPGNPDTRTRCQFEFYNESALASPTTRCRHLLPF